MANGTKQRRGTQNGHVGRPSIYPGKRRDRPVQVALTNEGLDALDAGVERTGYSKANYIERLLREEEARHALWEEQAEQNRKKQRAS